MTAREVLESRMARRHPSDVTKWLDDFRAEVRQEMMNEILEITEGTNIQHIGRTFEVRLGVQGTVRVIG